MLKLSDSVHLALVTDPTAVPLEGLLELARRCGVEHRVHVRPYVEAHRVSAFLRDGTIGVHPISHYANAEIALPTKLFEFLQAGLPVVVSDVAAMSAEMAAEQTMRDAISPKATAANISSMHAIHAFQCGEVEEADRLLAIARAGVDAVLDEIEAGDRPWYTRGAPSVANCLERFGTAVCLAHFFEHGKLAPRGTLPRLLDTEYLLAT